MSVRAATTSIESQVELIADKVTLQEGLANVSIHHAVISEVDRKIRNLAKPRNYTFRPVLIHVNGVDDSVLEERYFDKVIDFGELWS